MLFSSYIFIFGFLPLALSESHPFWQAEELPARASAEAVPLKHPGMVMFRTPGNVVALSSGQENLQMRFGSEKYAKFAYASRYGFSVESDERSYQSAVLGGMIGFEREMSHGAAGLRTHILIAVAAALAIAQIRAGAGGVEFVGSSIVPTPLTGGYTRFTGELKPGYWMAGAAGLFLVVLALLRNAIIGKARS